jgi:cytochrome c oxidase cbb3-type subunit III
MSDDKDLLIKGHDYDGIQELDHPLPSWWLLTFLGTIIFGYLYWIHYESGAGITQKAELTADLARIESLKASAPKPSDSDSDLKALLGSAPLMEEGKSVYISKCAACHGPEMQGLIGPNLTDEFWLNGQGKLSGIAGVIRQGVLEKGMPAWGEQLKESEVKGLVVYIASLKGSNPTNPKAPQGERFVGD